MDDVDDRPESEESYRALQRRADRICSLIVASDYPAIDVVIEIRKLREFVERNFPGRERLFDVIYRSRFRRLWSQFRSDAGGRLDA
ncbi:MAG: hypothetical protein GXY85_01910 [Candidatus Brocadiaceae bacterium]|nr:hypothetical protein [Candidatus Brocadiaceae bacterium]